MIKFTDVTLTPDTLIFASGDVIDAVTEIPDAFPVTAGVDGLSGGGMIVSMTIIDEDDQGSAFDVYFMRAAQSLGTENAAPSISDAAARDIVGYVAVATADYKDLGGVRIAVKTGLQIACAPAAGSRALYVGVVNGSGTPTYTASGLKLRVGISDQA